MSGHSKWHNIQAKKGKSDAQRGKIFTKIGREIAVIVKAGGSDPVSNPKLRDVIAKAKQNNMPNDSIERSIKKAAGEMSGVNYESCTYEGYGTGGSAVIVECLTDNKNRTAGDVRHAFDKFGGSLGSTGCVSYLFNRKGIVEVDITNKDLDTLMLDALEVGADDVAVLVGLHAVPLRLMLGALVVGVLPAQTLLVQLILQGAVAQTFITFPVVGRAALRTDDDVVAFLERLAADRTANALIIHYIQPFQIKRVSFCYLYYNSILQPGGKI